MTEEPRQTFHRNVLLTLGVFGPLVAAFLGVVNFYPVPVWSLFSDPGDIASGKTSYTLLGQTAAGDWRSIPPIGITAGLYGRQFMMVSYTDANLSFHIHSPHPNNVRLMAGVGGADRLPRGARMPDLLRAWGDGYNRRLPAGSTDRLVRVRLEACRWPGGRYGDYEVPEHSWEVEL